VKVIGADDKRQITVCIGSSLDGDLLPPQLIFQGKTTACHPPTTDTSLASHAHITHSDNHWSTQETMQQWVKEVLIPYADRRIFEHTLPYDSKIVLVLDVWAVHKSEEFRLFLRTYFPRIHLVFVPANCTSELQVADVILQRPFKHGVRLRFNKWAALILKEQIESGELVGLSPFLKMSSIKPLCLQWIMESWSRLADETEDANEEESDTEEEDDDKDELDVMKERAYGTRKSERKRTAPIAFGFQINSQQIAMSEDSDR
jgi:hypothetical protein